MRQNLLIKPGPLFGGHATVHYYATIYDTKIAARVAAYNTAGADVNANTHGGWGGSISGLHSSGISLTFAAAQQDYTARATQTSQQPTNALVGPSTNTPHSADDPTNLWVRVGYKLNYFNIGNTNLSANWQESEDLNGTDQTVEVFGLNIVQEFDAYGTEIYGGYANFDLETGTNAVTDYEDIDAGWVGMRVKF